MHCTVATLTMLMVAPLQITLRLWGANDYPRKVNESMLFNSVHVDGEDTYGTVNVQVNPLDGHDAWSVCVRTQC